MQVEIFAADVPPGVTFESNKVFALPVANLPADDATYYSSTPSLLKALSKSNVPNDYLNKPLSLFEQRGAEWFGPTLLVLSNLYSSNPDIFKTLLDAIKNHVLSLYPSDIKPTIKFSMQLEKGLTSKSTIVSFEGTTDNFSELLKTIENTWNKK
jgi:hypothetical protein